MRQERYAIKDMSAIHAILETGRVGRLATLDKEGYPYIVPMNYVFWDKMIYVHCARKGEKTDNLLREPKVCFEVDFPLAYLDTAFDTTAPPCHVSQFYRSVIIRGKAELVQDESEKLKALNRLMASHENEPAYKAITPEMPGVKACHVVRINIEKISGKENLAQKKNDETKEQLAAYLEKRNRVGDTSTAELIRENHTKTKKL